MPGQVNPQAAAGSHQKESQQIIQANLSFTENTSLGTVGLIELPGQNLNYHERAILLQLKEHHTTKEKTPVSNLSSLNLGQIPLPCRRAPHHNKALEQDGPPHFY